jgi:sulfotransferase family protein
MPDLLLHIGYHKTGTSWLQRFLFGDLETGFLAPPLDRPEIGRNLIHSNPLVFDPKECRERFSSWVDEAFKRGLCPVLSEERLSGTPHAGGYDSKELANRLHQVFPEGKVVIVIREQKSMILSVYKQYVRAGGTASLTAYLEPNILRKLPLFDYTFFEYHRLIKYYIALFGDSRVLVLPYEQFPRNAQQFIASIISFAGVRYDKPLQASSFENSSLSVLLTNVQRRLNRLVRRDPFGITALPLLKERPGVNYLLDQCLRRLDLLISSPIRQKMDQRLKAVIAERVEDRYKESNRLTCEAMGVELKQYGYDT